MRIDRMVRQLINDPARSLKERVFIVLTLTATGMAAIALLGDILYGENIVEIITLSITIVLVPLITFFSIRFGKIDHASILVSVGLIFVIMPVIFIFGGGVNGGAIAWLIFSYLYIGLVLFGRWRVGSLLTLTLVVVFLYSLGFRHPELIHEHTRRAFYIDSALGVIEVGFVCFVMTWHLTLLYEGENKKAREETQRAEDLIRSQNRFFSSMSHEIRTPINSILGLNEIILRQKDASAEIRNDAANIQGAGRMLLALINDILDFSKIEAGRMDIVPVNYSIASLVSEIVNMIWLRAEQKGLEFSVEIDPSIPSELYGDEVRIKQILINLLNNAVKYTKEGSVTLHIEKEDDLGDQVVLLFSVTDTGMGIKQDAIPHLFEAFRRIDEEKNASIEGTGLGLSIVNQLVELMGGRITVNSVYTQGSTFTVTLRQKVTSKAAVGEIRLKGTGSTLDTAEYTPGFQAPEARILIVDDNEMNLVVEKKLLADTEIRIDTVTSGEEALALTLKDHYDVILMDHLMPDMDGIECLQHIRRQPGGLNNRVPVIALTANAGSENRALYARSGFEDYLVKPVSGRELEEMLLLYLPESRITHTRDTDLTRLSMNTARSYSRKIPVLIVTSSICDLPRRVLREYQIDTIPFLIRSGKKAFYDSIEAEAGELIRYMKEGFSFEADPPSPEDYEAFFAEELKKAHNLIYVSIADGLCPEYANARAAARAYENVRIFNSDSNSIAVGFLVLIAQRMAARGDSPEDIISELEKAKKRLNLSFVSDGSYYVLKQNLVKSNMADFVRTLNIRPFIRCRKGRYVIERFSFGDTNKCFRRYIDHAIPAFIEPDLDAIFVIGTDLSSAQTELIRARLMRRAPFKNIFFLKASAVMSLFLGTGAFGLLYMERGSESYSISSMLLFEEKDVEDADDSQTDEDASFGNGNPGAENRNTRSALEDSGAETRPVPPSTDDPGVPDGSLSTSVSSSAAESAEPKWYDRIEGIDGQAAVTHSGSEETFRTVLKIFYESIEDKAAEIDGFYNTENWEDYTIKVHALKSSARLIGADALADEALDLENAGKEGRIDHIRAHHAALLSHLTSYLPILGRALDEEKAVADTEISNSNEPSAPAISADESFERYLLESVCEALTEAAAAHDDTLITDTFDELEEYSIPEKTAGQFALIKEAFDKKDYDEMLALLGRLTAQGEEQDA